MQTLNYFFFNTCNMNYGPMKSISIFIHVFKKDKNIFDLISIVWVLYMLAHEPKTNTFCLFVFYQLITKITKLV